MTGTGSSWQRLEELFREAVEQSPDERRKTLERVGRESPELLGELTDLLAADLDAEDFLTGTIGGALDLLEQEERADPGSTDGPPHSTGNGARPTGPPSGDPPEPDGRSDPHVGPRLGSHRLISEIGRGGMSRVFLADRVDGEYRQRVAVKLLRPGMDSREILRRFHNERLILARLEHPHIARLYDGGTTAAGHPYFVMEHIEGRPIDRFADEEGLGVEERIRLFQTVCRAVHYAHQNLVVHRDLKPTNVLVTPDGEPKLLDFGIAKLLDPNQEAEATRASFLPMTPGYASPEQVRGEAVTTASDVYSLGILLYRLLSGRLPFPVEDLSPAELERRLAEEDPPPPSAVAGKRRLAGDLDTIVACAMAREPSRRYASAEQLARDLQRHLDGHPVVARPATFSYRASRFLARHGWAAAAVAAIGFLLLVLLVSMAVQSSRIAEERDRAERVSQVLIDLFEVADPGDGQTVTAREMLDLGARRVRREVDGPPALRATLLETIANAYRNLGLYDSAEPLLAEALGLRRTLPEDPALATALDQLGVLHALQGDYAGAEPLMAEGLALRERILPPGHPSVAASLNNLALLRHDRGDYAGAEPLYQRALEADRRAAGPDAPSTWVTRSNLALLLYDMGRYDEAQRRFRELVDARRAHGFEDDPALAVDLGHLGRALLALGRYGEAEAVLREALERVSSRESPEHPDLARTLHDVAEVLTARGRPEEAEPLVRRALEIRSKMLGEGHPETAASRLILGRTLATLGDVGGAEREIGRAVEAFREGLPAGHLSLGEALLMEGEVLAGSGRCPGALPPLKEARAVLVRTLRPGDRRIEKVEDLLGSCRAEARAGSHRTEQTPR